MKNFTLFPLQNHRNKLIGIIITTLSIVFVVFAKMGIVINVNLTIQQIFQILNLTTIIGLFLIVFSKEKIDDERVKKIRLKSLQFGFGMILSLIISLIFVSIIHPAFSFDGTHDLSLISLICLIAYLIFFNAGIYFDLKEIYIDDTVLTNINKNRVFFIFYTLGLLLIVILLILI
jgi:hypothetical protein